MNPLPADQLLERIRTDERFFVELCLSVTDRATNKKVPFKLNPIQEWYESVKSRFDVILKARKVGFSTRIIASDIWACAFMQNQHAVLVTQNDKATMLQLEDRVKPMLQSCALPLGAELRKNHILFPATRSRYWIGTAGTRTFGRGADITRYHLSEYAHWEKPDLITGIEEACMDGAVGRIETTANGENFFKGDWSRAAKGESRYKPVFVPWFRDPAYRLPGVPLGDGLTEDEQKLVNAYNLDMEQLAWRRSKIKGMSQPELFVQEYPSNPEEAFLSSGRMVFDWVALIQHEKNCIAPKWKGYLRDDGERVRLDPNPAGGLSVWDTPERGHVYVIGADVAEGIKGGAYSVASVMDAGTGTQVAEWHGHLAPDLFGDVLCSLGAYYNNALLAPEAWPGPGAVTMARVAQLGYKNFYVRPERGRRDKPEQLYGWETTARTRTPMIMGLAAATRDFHYAFHSRGLLEEMRSMVYDSAGNIEPAVGCFSDRVMASGIAWAVMREVASGVRYAKPKLRELENMVNRAAGASSPRWRGPRYGVRRQEAT